MAQTLLSLTEDSVALLSAKVKRIFSGGEKCACVLLERLELKQSGLACLQGALISPSLALHSGFSAGFAAVLLLSMAAVFAGCFSRARALVSKIFFADIAT